MILINLLTMVHINKKDYHTKYQRKYRKNLRHKLKANQACRKSIQKHKKYLHELKINGCAICGYNECDAALDFHHVNPEDKKFHISISTISRKDIFDELNKCILLCKNCHKEVEQVDITKI